MTLTKTTLSFAVLVLAGTCAAPPRTGSGPKDFRLVIDAGSSGTRFCMFKLDGACRIVNAHEKVAQCSAVASPDGLAALGVSKAADVIRSGVGQIAPADRARLAGAVILGTGGFRAIPIPDRNMVMQSAVEALKESGVPASGFVLKGEEEAALAWESVRQIFGSAEHSTLETGGATVQLTTGIGQPDQVISTPEGLNLALGNVEKLPAFAACRPGPSAEFDACRSLATDKIFRNSNLRRAAGAFSAAERGRALYGMGAPWAAVFKIAGRDEVDKAALEQIGRTTCKKSVDELPKGGADHQKAERACWLFAYQSALLETVGAVRIKDGRESWPRGAAASTRYFPGCTKIN